MMLFLPEQNYTNCYQLAGKQFSCSCRKGAGGLFKERICKVKCSSHSQALGMAEESVSEDIVLMHHERFDGKGYPIGKAGADIPIGARIIAICDSIDAITSNRCYRKAHNFDYCYEEIEKNLGKMYDPIVGIDVLDNWDEITSVVNR